MAAKGLTAAQFEQWDGTHRSTSGPLDEVDGIHAIPFALARALPGDVRHEIQERDEAVTPWPQTAAWLRQQRHRRVAPLPPGEV